MKDLRKWRFRFVIVALVVGGFLGWMALQQISPAEAVQKVQKLKPGLQAMPSSVKGPPEMEQLKDDKAAPTQERARPTRDALLQKVTKQQGGQEKVQKAKAKQQAKTVLGASSTEPPEMVKLKDMKAVPTKERARPTRDTLLQHVFKQPGGKEKIQNAQPKGFKQGAWSLPSLFSFNPFKARVAHASDATTLVLTPQYSYRTSPFAGWLYTMGEMGGYYNPATYRARFYNYTSSILGARVYKPWAYVRINAPSSGWYLFNFETYNGAKATLKHYTSSGYVTVQTWDEHTHAGWTDHPALVNLSAGYHSFYWIVEPGSSYNMYLYRVSVEKM